MQYKNVYKEKCIIGRGNFGVATLVTEKSTDSAYIAKKITLTSLNDYEISACQLESRLLERLNHPNIVRYKECFLEPSQLIIVMEYCPGGDLSQLIKSHKQTNSYFPESQIFEWMSQLLSALQYLDSNRVIHRDIKSSNVYLTVDGTLKLGDFGIAKALSLTSDMAQTVVGTPYYMSPEVCENRPYTSKSDVWSLGCLLYEIAALKHPFGGSSFLALVMNILKESPAPLSCGYSEEMREIVRVMLTKDMKERPSAANILKMRYFLVEKEGGEDKSREEGGREGERREEERREGERREGERREGERRERERREDNFEEGELSQNEYEFDNSSSSETGLASAAPDCLGISELNPMELLSTQNLEDSRSDATDYSYSITIPTFTADIQINERQIFPYADKLKSIRESNEGVKGQKRPSGMGEEEEYEYEDDFESVCDI